MMLSVFSLVQLNGLLAQAERDQEPVRIAALKEEISYRNNLLDQEQDLWHNLTADLNRHSLG